jgi:hypothetical protein
VRRTLGALVIAAVMLGLPLAAHAAHQTMVLPTLLGEYHLTYDNRKVNEADLKPLVILSPHLAGWSSIAVTPRLERCVVGETQYLDCRDRSVSSPTFLWNARVNLQRGAAMLDGLRAMRAPAELDPVVTWLQSSLAFSLWLEETKLEFYQSGDVNVLRRRYGEMEPARGCAAALEQVQRGVASNNAQYDMVVLPWHNCVNDMFRRRLGDYPMAAWQHFLSKWGIQERFVELLPQASGK